MKRAPSLSSSDWLYGLVDCLVYNTCSLCVGQTVFSLHSDGVAWSCPGWVKLGLYSPTIMGDLCRNMDSQKRGKIVDKIPWKSIR
jgi:hypothetical protein